MHTKAFTSTSQKHLESSILVMTYTKPLINCNKLAISVKFMSIFGIKLITFRTQSLD